MAFSIGFFCSHSAHNVTLRRIQNLNGFSIGFCCSHSAHNVTLRRIQNLNGFSIGFFCSHSAHNVTLRRIQNLNGFSIGFFCSHSAHSMTLRRIQRLPDQCGARSGSPQIINSWCNIVVNTCCGYYLSLSPDPAGRVFDELPWHGKVSCGPVL